MGILKEWGLLTSYAVVEKPQKERSKYDKARVVLEDHLGPDCPVEEAGVRWVSEPPEIECEDHVRQDRIETHTRILPPSRGDVHLLCGVLPYERSW